MIFSGEESTASEQAIQLDNGLRLVQLLDLGGSQNDKEKDADIEESSNIVSNLKHEHGQVQGHLPLHKKRRETLPKESAWEDISDESDDGTPERDLPGT